LRYHWVTCRARASEAAWQAYPALCAHFAKKRTENRHFIKDLVLMMINILEELSVASLALQSQVVTIVKA